MQASPYLVRMNRFHAPQLLGRVKVSSCLEVHSRNSARKQKAYFAHRRLSVNNDSATRHAYWKRIPVWSDVSEDDFISYNWQVR